MNKRPPKDDHISFRTLPKYKRKAQELPCTYEDIFKAGLEELSSELNCLEHEKGELELEKAELEKRITFIETRIIAINNRIRYIAPSRLDKETLNSMIHEAAMDYAKDVFKRHGNDSLKRSNLDVGKSSILKTAREWGYDGSKFLKLVEDYLEKMCST